MPARVAFYMAAEEFHTRPENHIEFRGAKLFRCTPEMRTVFERPFLSRWIFDVEIIARYISLMKSPDEAARRIYEFPLDAWTDVKGSKLGPHDFARAAYDLFKIHRRYRG